MNLPEITDVQRLRLRPGDRLVVRAEGLIDMAQAEEIGRSVRGILRLPAQMPVLVTGGDISVEVLEGPGDA
jgi:hypothetical protein